MESLGYTYFTLEEYLNSDVVHFCTISGDFYENKLIRAFIKQIVPDYAEQFANGTIIFTEAQSLEMGGRLMGLLRPRLAQIKEWDGVYPHKKNRSSVYRITIFGKKYQLGRRREEHEEISALWTLVDFFYTALRENKPACIWDADHPKKYGGVFNKYIDKVLFAFIKYEIGERVDVYPLRPSTSAEPDFRADVDKGEQRCYIATRFLPMGERLTWGMEADLEAFNAYKVGTPFYLLLGLGTDESAPEALYLIPLEKVTGATLERSSLAPYAIPLGQLVHRAQLWGQLLDE